MQGGSIFSGSIDDVRIYNRALSPDEIKRLYNIGGTTKVNTTRKDTLQDGLAGHWSFDGPDLAGVTAYDRSGSGNNGTLTLGPTRSVGKIGQALSFDGVDDYVSVSAASSINNLQSGMTVSLWIRPTITPPSDTRLLSKRNSTGWNLNANIGSVTSSLIFLASFSGGTLRAVSNNGVFTVGAWTHVATVWDGTLTSANVKFYSNGLVVGHTSDLDGIGSVSDDSGSTLSIAALVGGINPFSGSLDDVRVYNRMLSEQEIKRLHNMGR